MKDSVCSVNKNIHYKHFVFIFSSYTQFLFLNILAQVYLIIFELQDLPIKTSLVHNLVFPSLLRSSPSIPRTEMGKGNLSFKEYKIPSQRVMTIRKGTCDFGFYTYFSLQSLSCKCHITPFGVQGSETSTSQQLPNCLLQFQDLTVYFA